MHFTSQDDWKLGNCATFEVVSLHLEGRKAVSVELQFDEQGFGVILAVAEHGDIFTQEVQEAFKLPLYSEPGTGQLFIETIFEEGKPGAPTALDDVKRTYNFISFDLPKVGIPPVSLSLHGALFELPRRDGCQVAFDLGQIVKVLDLDPAKACSSARGKWLHNRWKAWEEWMELLHFPGVLLRSQQFLRDGEELHPERCLPWAAATSAGLVTILCRLMGSSKRVGGICDERGICKEAVRMLLHRLIRVACERPWRMRILFDDCVTMERAPAPAQGRGCRW